MKKNIIITGAKQDIGFEVARQLPKNGDKIILACRNRARRSPAMRFKKRFQKPISTF